MEDGFGHNFMLLQGSHGPFSASWERFSSKQAQRLGGLGLMAVTHFFGATKPVSSPMPKV
jgi:hypothetical protein